MHDKIIYIRNEVVKRLLKRQDKNDKMRFKILTFQGIEAVLRHPPRNPNKVTMKELNRINRSLSIPVHIDAISEIIDVSKEYDQALITDIKVERKTVQKDDEFYTTHRNIFKECAI
jgi:predicted metal-binding protein